MYSVVINGLGRIGKLLFKLLLDTKSGSVNINYVNDLMSIEDLAYSLRYDSIYPRMNIKNVEIKGTDQLQLGANSVQVKSFKKPEEFPVGDCDLLIDCTGQFKQRTQLEHYIAAGVCKRVLLSNPAADSAQIDYTVISELNMQQLQPAHKLISAASCTTAAAIPTIVAIDRALEIQHVHITTLHSLMNDQNVLDTSVPADKRLGRAAGMSIVPVATSLAAGVERVLTHLEGKVSAETYRVPIHCCSMQVLQFFVLKPVSREQLLGYFCEYIQQHKSSLAMVEDDCVSIDFLQSPYSATIDIQSLQLISENTNKMSNNFSIRVWFDNEFAYANRLSDIVHHLQESLVS